MPYLKSDGQLNDNPATFIVHSIERPREGATRMFHE